MAKRSKTTAGLGALALVMVMGSAAGAADMALRGSLPGYEAPAGNWGGFYAGAFYGYSSGSLNPTGIFNSHTNAFQQLIPTNTYLPAFPAAGGNATRGAFGVFAGYQVQFEDAVVGFEVDYTRLAMRRDREFPAADGSVTVPIASQAGPAGTYDFTNQRLATSLRINDYMTFRVRGGWDLGYFMPFMTAGLVVGRGNENAVLTADTCASGGCGATTPVRYEYNKPVVSAGIAYGAGIDMKLAQYLLLRAEYQGVTFAGFGSASATVHTVRVGAGLRY